MNQIAQFFTDFKTSKAQFLTELLLYYTNAFVCQTK